MNASQITGPEDEGFQIERRLAALATYQHGVVARRQLLDLPMSDTMIGDRIDAGRLHTLYKGVYAVGHRDVSPLG